MKIRCFTTITVVGRPEPGDYQGNKTYKLNILAGDSAGDIKCSEDAYMAACSFSNPLETVSAELLYNSEYKTMQITRILPAAPPNTDKKPSPANK